MEENQKKNKKIIVAIISVVVLVAIIGIVAFFVLNAQKLKLYNATLELGKENYIEELTKQENIYIEEGYTFSVKDNKIDINNVGIYDVTFEIKGKGKSSEEIKKIKVQDTTPPTVELKKSNFYIGDSINVEEIVSIKDLSQVEEISYSDAKAQVNGQFDTTKEGESIVNITVEDKNGNKATQELKISVTNPIVSLYDYVIGKIKEKKTYSIGSYDDKFVIKYNYNFGNGISSSGWVNFTEKVYYNYSKVSTGFSTVKTADISYFNDTCNIDKVYKSAGLTTGVLAIDSYLKNAPSGFELETGDISTYQSSLNSEISSINSALNNKDGKINLVGKTIDQLKNETIDLREMQ